MRVSSFWLTLLMVLGMIGSIVGMAGWIVGYFYADPSMAEAHPIMHPLAKIAVIVGPIMVFGGGAIFLASVYGISKQRTATVPPAEAPKPIKQYAPREHRMRLKEEGLVEEYEMPDEERDAQKGF